MKIGLYKFNILADAEKLELLFEHGAKLKTRKTDENIINLYSLSDFYVEVYYDLEKDRVLNVKTSKTPIC